MLCIDSFSFTVQKNATIHQVTTILATHKNVLFPGHNHLITTGTDDQTLAIITLTGTWAIIKVPGHQHRWLAGGYELEMGHFYEWLAWWLLGG